MDDTKITQLRAVDIKGEPNPAIITELERNLALAKEGKLRGIAIAAVYTGGDTSSSFVIDGTWATLIGAAQYIVHRLCVYGDNN
jgi:hypothetical protein